MNFRDILGSASSNLWRAKGRTILTIIAIFIGSFTISLTLALNAGINDYIDRQLGSVGGDNVIVVTPKMDEEANSGPRKYGTKTDTTGSNNFSMTDLLMTESDQTKIAEIDGVKKVQTTKSPAVSYIEYGEGDKYEISAAQQVEGFAADLLAGSDLTDEATNQILLPLAYVEPLGFANENAAVGQEVTLAVINKVTGKDQVFIAKIVGVLNKTIVNLGAGSNAASLNEHLTQSMLDYENTGVPTGMLNQGTMTFMVVLDEGASPTEVKQRIIDAGYDAQTVGDMIGQVKSIIDAITIVLVAFAAIALLAASFGIVNTLYMSVSERTREIGLMKAMGMGSGKVFAIFSIEAILLGFWGSLMAVLAAFGAGQAINQIANQTFLKDLTGFTLMEYPISNIALVMGLIMLIAFLAGALPARRAAKKNPIDALRYE